MRKILFYVTKQGKSPVHDYLAEDPKNEIEQAERELKDFIERSGFYGSKK